MSGDHAIAWSHLYEGGRAWYTAGGHTRESYAEPLFQGHVLGGILWAAGPPAVGPLRGVVRGSRLDVTGTVAKCIRCSAQLRVRLDGRSAVAPLRIDGATFRGRTTALPRGRWTYVVTVRSDASGLRATRTGAVRIG